MESKSLRGRLNQELYALQQQTSVQPYSVVHRLALAKSYKKLGYPDLAAGDAYKALLLVDEVVEEGEYHDEATEAAETDFLTERMASLAQDAFGKEKSGIAAELVVWVQTILLRDAYNLLIRCLLDCGCLRSVSEFITRAMVAFPEDPCFPTYKQALSRKIRSCFETKGDDYNHVGIEDYPDKGLVRRENYLWNKYEPDRFSDTCLQFLRAEMESIAPKLEVRVCKLPLLAASSITPAPELELQYVSQLGLFAKEDIPPGEQILQEKSLLTGISRLHDVYCDACSALLPNSREVIANESSNTTVSCEECDEVYFCSPECHDLAQDSYHPSLCGLEMDQGTVSAREAADSLYMLLLVRALALAETQDLHPLELKEVRYIWGDYHNHDLDSTWQTDSTGQLLDAFGSVPQTLPFSFTCNVLTPLHILEKMDVNIFTQSHRYDTWIFNTLYAKFRGTASARQGLDGRPEIGAVHPMWCLANHSCDPNVAWEWQGSMRFWTRETLVDWAGGNPSKVPGLKKGEEIFSHYCDVRLPVKERREWAAGALGGECVCARCIWEENKEA